MLRGLSINGQGGSNGILAQQAARVRVENCVISGMAAVGIYHTAPNAEMIVTDAIVRDNEDGLAIIASDATMFVGGVRSERNNKGGFYIAPAAAATVTAGVVDSVFAYNGIVGIWANAAVASATTFVDLVRSVVYRNGDGFKTTATASGAKSRVTLRHSTFTTNTGYGAVIVGTSDSAQTIATIADNHFHNNGNLRAVSVDGSAAAYLSRNSSVDYVECVNGGGIYTWQDNDLFSLHIGCPTIAIPPR